MTLSIAFLCRRQIFPNVLFFRICFIILLVLHVFFFLLVCRIMISTISFLTINLKVAKIGNVCVLRWGIHLCRIIFRAAVWRWMEVGVLFHIIPPLATRKSGSDSCDVSTSVGSSSSSPCSTSLSRSPGISSLSEISVWRCDCSLANGNHSSSSLSDVGLTHLPVTLPNTLTSLQQST